MDESQFDDITRALAATNSRRRVLRGVAASVAVAVGAAFGVGSAEAKPKQDPCKIGCAGFGKKASKACEQACKECGGDIDRVCPTEGPFGPTAFACCAAGTFCVGNGVCCPEGTEPCFDDQGNPTCCPEGTFCNFEVGGCQELTTCPSGEPAENCFAGVETSCDPDGVCALVDDADGDDCLCVERVCTDVPCATDADCADSGGVCVTIPGCCPDTTFCAIPCGSAGAGAQSSGGWQR